MVGGSRLLDLCYEEDVAAEVDMNVVMTAGGRLIEIQGTGEEATFSPDQLAVMLELGKKGITELVARQEEVIANAMKPADASGLQSLADFFKK
jgi:ribonuclease PH